MDRESWDLLAATPEDNKTRREREHRQNVAFLIDALDAYSRRTTGMSYKDMIDTHTTGGADTFPIPRWLEVGRKQIGARSFSSLVARTNVETRDGNLVTEPDFKTRIYWIDDNGTPELVTPIDSVVDYLTDDVAAEFSVPHTVEQPGFGSGSFDGAVQLAA